MASATEILYEYYENEQRTFSDNERKIIKLLLFGISNWGKNSRLFKRKLDALGDLYAELYSFGTQSELIDLYQTQDKLDEMIKIIYQHGETEVYRKFCNMKIKIGKTSSIDPDSIADESVDSLDQVIQNKIDGYKNQDLEKGRFIDPKKYVTINYFKFLLKEQENKCYNCGETVVTSCWTKNCLSHMTLDRINNELSHNSDNVKICCYYCNCFKNSSKNMSCPSGCHMKKLNNKKRTNAQKKKSS